MLLHHKVLGEGQPLILLHGLFGSLNNWRLIARELASFYRVVLVDQRNHGHSPHREGMEYCALAADLRELMDALGLTSAHLLGHSMGGKTAMQFAGDYPERVDHLIVVDVAPRAYPSRHEAILNALLSLDLTWFTRREDLDAVLARDIPNPAVRQFLLANLMRDGNGRFRWRMNLAAIQRGYSQVNDAITLARPVACPALFVRGGRSDYIQDADIPEIYRLFPKAQIVTLPNAGHWLSAETSAQVVRLTLSFLANGQVEEAIPASRALAE